MDVEDLEVYKKLCQLHINESRPQGWPINAS
jgi:hypothetical protein